MGRRPSERMRMLDDQDVVRLLRSEVERAGGQSSWARRERIDRTLLNRVLCGRKPPTGAIIRALKLCNDYACGERGAARARGDSETLVGSTR
jgi:hypothetical protein